MELNHMRASNVPRERSNTEPRLGVPLSYYYIAIIKGSQERYVANELRCGSWTCCEGKRPRSSVDLTFIFESQL